MVLARSWRVRGESPPRITGRGGSRGEELMEERQESERDLVHRSRAYRSAAAAGWPGRAVRARPGLRLPGADVQRHQGAEGGGRNNQIFLF